MCECALKVEPLIERDFPGEVLDCTLEATPRVFVSTCRRDPESRKRVKSRLLASHCPFCGERYAQEPQA